MVGSRWLVLVAALAAVAGCVEGPPARGQVHLGERRLDVTLARTHSQMRRGYQHADAVAPNTGIWFQWSRAAPRELWMHQVRMPLDVVWVRDGVVIGGTTMPPCTGPRHRCPRYHSPGPADAALETEAGTVAATPPGTPIRVILQ